MVFLLAGDALKAVGFPLPGNVTGMILLALALRAGVVRRDWVVAAANFLVENLSLLFVPAGVGVMAYFNVVRRSWLPISLSILVSTLFVLGFTGVLEERLSAILTRLRKRRGR